MREMYRKKTRSMQFTYTGGVTDSPGMRVWSTILKERGMGYCVGCCCSVTESYPTLCNPMDCSTPGLPALHYLPEFAQIHLT